MRLSVFTVATRITQVRRARPEPLSINLIDVEREHDDLQFQQQRTPTDAAGRAGVRHGDGERHAVYAYRNGDVLLLRHGESGIRDDDAGKFADGDAERRDGAEFIVVADSDGGRLCVYRCLQWRHELRKFDGRARAALDQPVDVEREHDDLPFQRQHADWTRWVSRCTTRRR